MRWRSSRSARCHTPPATPLTDRTAARLAHVDEPWAASYTIGDPGMRPKLTLRYDADAGTVVIKTDGALGPATVKLLDHHRVAIATRTQPIGAGETVFAFAHKGKLGAVYLQIGGFRDWVVADSYGQIADEWGQPPGPSAGDDDQ
ncbi:MAG TPA: hypothetical protein VH165_19400 [Kofleriaceae bacterium]|nr:hypothetical protein [Kofleriaceae bacterium]